MKIIKAEHKAFLYNLFNQGGQPKTFALEKLITASGAAKKLTEGTELVNEGKNMKFADGEVEFTPEEWVLLKDLFTSKKEATVHEAPVISDLKEIFNN